MSILRDILVLCLIAVNIAGCTTQTPAGTETTSVAPQLKPGEARARMGGQIGWYGTISGGVR